jgi:peptidoglycan-associated lipoprotein
MKPMLYLALVGLLLSGCAGTAVKEASIEDRSLKASAASADASPPAEGAAKSAAPDSGASVAPNPDVATKPLPAGGKAVASTGVETRGIETQAPQSFTLADGGSKSAAAAGAGQPDKADTLKHEHQPVLDPRNPESPLAQRRLLFDYDSAAIRDEYRSLLEMHAQYLKNEKTARLILQGHADERGSREYNLALGQRRSESVYKALGLLGVPDAQMEAVSLGEEKPVAEGHDENAWVQNRRAELLYQGE